jgi:hypothetical protein
MPQNPEIQSKSLALFVYTPWVLTMDECILVALVGLIRAWRKTVKYTVRNNPYLCEYCYEAWQADNYVYLLYHMELDKTY